MNLYESKSSDEKHDDDVVVGKVNGMKGKGVVVNEEHHEEEKEDHEEEKGEEEFQLTELERDARDHIQRLQQQGKLDKRVVVIPKSDKEEIEKAKWVATDSFAGTTHSNPELSLDYLLGTYFRSKGEECGGVLKEDPSDERKTAFYSMICFFFEICDFVLGIRDEETGELIGVSYVEYHTKSLSAWQMLQIVWRVGAKQILRNGLSFLRKMLTMMDPIEKIHHSVENPHYYVLVLAASPSHQGKGVGSSLLSVIASMADRDGLYSYLEASGVSNQGFYSRKGYDVIHRLESEEWGFNFEGGLACMLRPAASK